MTVLLGPSYLLSCSNSEKLHIKGLNPIMVGQTQTPVFDEVFLVEEKPACSRIRIILP